MVPSFAPDAGTWRPPNRPKMLVSWDHRPARQPRGPAAWILAAYPFSPVRRPIRVYWAGGPPCYAMCAIDALGMSAMLGRPVTITAAEPDSGRIITVEADRGRACWSPRTAVVFAGSAGDGCSSADPSCGYISFFTTAKAARQWARNHPEVTGTVLRRRVALSGIGHAGVRESPAAVPRCRRRSSRRRHRLPGSTGRSPSPPAAQRVRPSWDTCSASASARTHFRRSSAAVLIVGVAIVPRHDGIRRALVVHAGDGPARCDDFGALAESAPASRRRLPRQRCSSRRQCLWHRRSGNCRPAVGHGLAHLRGHRLG
ncbi:MAG: organomercurial lyase [Streptosporangiaceae bacterium]